MTDILDIEGIVRFPWESLFKALLLAIGAFLLSYFLYRLFRWWKARKNRPSNLTPHERAVRDIQGLERQKLVEKGHFKDYYFALDEIFRLYLTARYAYGALDRTPSEILAAMRAELQLPEERIKEAADFFKNAELAKFARLAPTSEQAQEDARSLKAWIQASLPPEPKGGSA